MRGVANILHFGFADQRKAGFDSGQNLRCVIHAQSSLRNHGQFGGLQRQYIGHIGHVFHQMDAAVELAHGALHLGVALVADHDEFIAFLVQLGHLDMHLGDQRAGGVKNLKATRAGFALHRLAHAMGREHQGSAGWHVVQLLNKNSAARFQVVHHVGVVHDLVAYVDGTAKLGQGPFHNLNCTVHPGAETTRFRQDNFLRRAHSTPINCTSNVTGWPANGWLKSNNTASALSLLPTCCTAPA